MGTNGTIPDKAEEKSGLAGDIFGAAAAMLVALPSSVAFGVVTYTMLGPEYAPAGAFAGMVGAAAVGLAAPLVGRTAGLISAPCAPASAVLTALIAALTAGSGLSPGNVLPLLAITAVFAALFQMAYGFAGGGSLIKFIPYPVVCGYLSAVAVIIAIGQIPKLLGLPSGTPLAKGLLSPDLWRWEGLFAGLAAIVVMVAAKKRTTKAPSAVIGLAGGVAAYFIASAFSPGLLTLDGNALVIGRIPASGSFAEGTHARLSSIFSMDVNSLKLVLIPALTLSALLSIDTLKTCVGLDALTGSRHNANRELIGQGVANMASAFAGGMPGAGTMGPTLVNVSSGGKTHLSGIMEGGFVVLAILLVGGLIAWVPIGALSGILLVIAWRMFDKGMFRLIRHSSTRFDFAVIVCVIAAALTIDLIAASGIGVGLAILLFIRDQIRGSVIRRKVYLSGISSKTRRIAAEREILARDGGKGVFCELQGNLFFGTTDQLMTQLDADLKKSLFFIFDMRRVQSMDYTAAHLFEQMQARLAARGGRLLLSGMPSAIVEERGFERYLREMGVVKKSTGAKVCDTLDAGLEWIEERILASAGMEKPAEEAPLELKDFHLMREFDASTLEDLKSCMIEASFAPGEKIVSVGDTGDELFLIRSGSVKIMLPLGGGKWHHIATISRGDFFGELAFLDKKMRSADVVAKTKTCLYVITRTKFNEKALVNAALGIRVFARLASSAAERLRQTDGEIRALEER